jgi:hypothetical protein
MGNLKIYERAGKKPLANVWWQVWQYVLNILHEIFLQQCHWVVLEIPLSANPLQMALYNIVNS